MDIRWVGRGPSATRTDRSIPPLHETITSIPASRITTRAPIRVFTAALNTAATEIGILVAESASILDRAIPDSVVTAPITAAGSATAAVSDSAVHSGTITITGTAGTAGTADTADTADITKGALTKLLRGKCQIPGILEIPEIFLRFRRFALSTNSTFFKLKTQTAPLLNMPGFLNSHSLPGTM